MSDNMATIGMINLTPLSLAVDMPPDHAPRSLRPFEAVDCPLWFELRRGNSNVRTKRGNKITLTHALTRDLLSTIDVEMMVSGGQTLPSIITIDTEFVRDPEKQPGPKCGDFIAEIDSYRRSGGQWPHQQLTVINETGRVADAYLLGMKEEKRFEKCLGRIEPGQTWQTPTQGGLLWQFRSPFSGEMIGMFMGRQNNSDSYTLTDEFRQGWLRYQNQSAVRSSTARFSPLRIIGERRNSTPERGDQAFITATTVRRDFSKDVFNGLTNRVLRDVEIAGVLLRWSGANKVLSNYYGEGAADIRSLTIFCDRMEVADRLHFPGTNVTIYARELVFTGIGRIDTTPLPSLRAQSQYLVADPGDQADAGQSARPMVPADATGTPTYQAADGHKGEPGGNVTLYVREARYIDDGLRGRWEGDPHMRFIMRGGKGQQGEAGGLKAYVHGEGRPEIYGPLPIIKPEDVASAF